MQCSVGIYSGLMASFITNRVGNLVISYFGGRSPL